MITITKSLSTQLWGTWTLRGSWVQGFLLKGPEQGHVGVWGLGFRGLGFRVLGFRVYGYESLRVKDFGIQGRLRGFKA